MQNGLCELMLLRGHTGEASVRGRLGKMEPLQNGLRILRRQSDGYHCSLLSQIGPL